MGASVVGLGEAPALPPSSMVRSSLGMILGRAASMGLGFLFWLFAARMFPPATVGFTAAVVSSMMLCTQVALCGVGSAFIAEFPGRGPQADSFLDTAITIVALASVAVGSLFLALGALAFRDLGRVAHSPAFVALFLAMSVLGTLNILLDQVSMALGKGGQVLSRNIAFGVVAAVLLVVLHAIRPGAGAAPLFSLWVAAGTSACLIGACQLRRSFGEYRYRPRAERHLAAGLIRVGLPNHALTLTERAPGLILPIIVIELLSPAQNAYWYGVWMMAWVVYIVPISMGIGLFAEVAHDPGALRAAIRTGVGSSLAVGGAAAVVLGGLAGPLLGLLGHRYAAEGTTPLRILLLGLVPLTFVQVYFAVCRAAARLPEAILTGTVSGLVAIGAAGLAAPGLGLAGMAWAWVLTLSVTGAFALVRLAAIRPAEADGVPEMRPWPAPQLSVRMHPVAPVAPGSGVKA